MKKIATGASLIAAIGFSALSVAPAAAVTLPFPNCDTAEALSLIHISEPTRLGMISYAVFCLKKKKKKNTKVTPDSRE
ncbi:hypothetical protein BN3590_03567 [Clostridium sp. C105KSO15]|nr:hypothetical protein BN3590_03567 [Clostridium sp. C105KSO15]